MLPINNNPLTCDCRDYDIIAQLRIFNRSDWLDGVYCNLPLQLAGKEVRYTVWCANRAIRGGVIAISVFDFITLNIALCDAVTLIFDPLTLKVRDTSSVT